MKKEKSAASVSTFLGADASLEGTIEFQGTIRLDGKVKGKVLSRKGTLIIGEKAVVDAEISVDVAIVMGEVKGSIDAGQRLEVYPPARIIGDIQAPLISMDAGVVFNGNCRMKPTQADLKPPKPSSKKAPKPADQTAAKSTVQDKSESK